MLKRLRLLWRAFIVADDPLDEFVTWERQPADALPACDVEDTQLCVPPSDAFLEFFDTLDMAWMGDVEDTQPMTPDERS